MKSILDAWVCHCSHSRPYASSFDHRYRLDWSRQPATAAHKRSRQGDRAEHLAGKSQGSLEWAVVASGELGVEAESCVLPESERSKGERVPSTGWLQE